MGDGDFTDLFSLDKSFILGWWLTTVVLATQKAEIRRTEVQSQPRQTVHKTYLQNTQ
jgi:tricorn protease-like protein